MFTVTFSQKEKVPIDSIPDFLKVYINCDACYLFYIKQNLTFIQFVNDQSDADVYILVTTQLTGSGGWENKYIFEGQGKFKGLNDTLIYTTKAYNTDAEKRQSMLKLLAAATMYYISKTPFYENISISSTESTSEYFQTDTVDKWKKWVFEIEAGGNAANKKTSNQTRINNGISISKITPKYKLEFTERTHYSWDFFDINDQIVKSTANYKLISTYFAKNLTKHWAIGGKYYLYSGTALNIKAANHICPAIEYNVFNYSEAARRQMRFMNKIEFKQLSYYDTTIYNSINEYRINNIFSVGYEIKEKFGNIFISIQAYNYLDDITKYRYSLSSESDIRIVKGLFLKINCNANFVNDQIYLPKKTVSKEDILLGNKVIASSYNFNFSLGLRFTFGSIYNSVVNPIFEDI